MPRYKDSLEIRAAKQERKNKLRELLSAMDVEDMSDLKSLFKDMVWTNVNKVDKKKVKN